MITKESNKTFVGTGVPEIGDIVTTTQPHPADLLSSCWAAPSGTAVNSRPLSQLYVRSCGAFYSANQIFGFFIEV